jgi:hypothetical protein
VLSNFSVPENAKKTGEWEEILKKSDGPKSLGKRNNRSF